MGAFVDTTLQTLRLILPKLYIHCTEEEIVPKREDVE